MRRTRRSVVMARGAGWRTEDGAEPEEQSGRAQFAELCGENFQVAASWRLLEDVSLLVRRAKMENEDGGHEAGCGRQSVWVSRAEAASETAQQVLQQVLYQVLQQVL